MQPHLSSPLYSIMHPKSVAVIGASNSMLTMGTTILNNMLTLGFPGEVFPVHPSLKEVLGLKSYSEVKKIPVVPDLAFIVVRHEIVAQVLRECGEKGIRRAIIVSGGFRESGEEGQRRESELKEVAEHYGIRFVGPNCIGVVNPGHGFNTTMFHYTADMKGFIGMASQSGSFVTQMFAHLEKFGLGFSQGISVGNQGDIDLADCVEYLSTCPRTRVIGLYIEGLVRPRKFMAVAREASRQKPLVAMYVGGTDSGRRAGWSHSGSLAGADAVYDGVFRQCGIVRADTIEELFDYCWALGTQPLISGNNVAVVTHSGGPGAAAADAADRAGLSLPALSPTSQEKLQQLVPNTGSLNNPIDTTFTRSFEDLVLGIPEILLEDEQLDGLLVYFLFAKDNFKNLLEKVESPLFKTVEEFDNYLMGLSHRFSQLVKPMNKPLLGSSFLTRSEGFIRVLQDCGIPVLPSPERSARAMGALYQYAQMRARLTQQDSAPAES